MATETARRPSLFVGLLNLNAGSVIGVDGQSIVLKANDFVGISNPSALENEKRKEDEKEDGVFHLVTVRGSILESKAKSNAVPSNRNIGSALTVGLVLVGEKVIQQPIIRRWNPQTEEISAGVPDEETCENLLSQVEHSGIQPHRILPYHQVVSIDQATQWKDRTCHITKQLLLDRGMQHGDKVVPGTFQEEQNQELNQNKPIPTDNRVSVDGRSLVYPNIPVVTRDKIQCQKHAGTKAYLQELSPEERTALFLQPNPSTHVFQHILARYYHQDWKLLLGDIQLSYIIFLHLQCFASLEHWRDCVAMLANVEATGMLQYSDLYHQLLDLMSQQMTSTMERDFFEVRPILLRGAEQENLNWITLI